MNFNAQEYLKILAGLPDSEIDLGPAALALAFAAEPAISTERYFNHLKKLADETGARFRELINAGADDSVETQLAALKHIIADKYGYKGDEETYDDLQNASLVRVIDRAKGLPITLSILYMHAARAQGWEIAGLNFPGHFVCKLGVRLIFDPFNGCNIMSAADLRAAVKRSNGPQAELSVSYFESTSNREILIRLQNNIKFRQITAEDYEGALKTVEIMRLIDPDEFRLLLDAGVLYARTDKPQTAIDMLEDYIKKAPGDRDRHEAALLLQQLKDALN